MCLSTAFKIQDDQRILLGNHVTNVLIQDSQIILSTLLGEEITLTGRLESMDLIRNEIIILAD